MEVDDEVIGKAFFSFNTTVKGRISVLSGEGRSKILDGSCKKAEVEEKTSMFNKTSMISYHRIFLLIFWFPLSLLEFIGVAHTLRLVGNKYCVDFDNVFIAS